MVTEVLDHLGETRVTDSQTRPLPGAEGYPEDAAMLNEHVELFAKRFGVTELQARAMWQLCGTRAEAFLAAGGAPGVASDELESVSGTAFPRMFVRQIIEHEWCLHLTDLVTRRLMLLYTGTISRATLCELVQLMQQQGRITAEQSEREIEQCVRHLRIHHGMQLQQEN